MKNNTYLKIKNPILLLLMVFVIVMVSCTREVSLVTHEIQGEFSIDLPDYMAELDLEHPEASFQFGNYPNEHYAIGLREAKEDFSRAGMRMELESYAEFNVSLLKMGLTDPKIEMGEAEQINGMDAIGCEVHGIFAEVDLEIYYNIMFYQSTEAMYYINTWTLADREDQLKENMNKITHSLKEI